MDYTPPIESRTTAQLIEIIATKEAWKEDVILRAEKELAKRGVPLTVGANRRKSRINFERRMKRIKSEASYSAREKLLIVLLGPLLFLVLEDLAPFHVGQGFKRKNRQAIIFQIVGLLLWGILIYLYFSMTA